MKYHSKIQFKSCGDANMDPSPFSSILGSIDGSRYEQLLGTVTGLQSDLQRTLVACQSLRNENEHLKKEHDVLQHELLKTKEKYGSQRKQLIEAVNSKIEGDQATEVAIQKWRIQLEARSKELETVKAQLIPQDLDIIRAQVQEDLEIPHRNKIKAVEEEAEKHRQVHFSLRREVEQYKSELEQSKINYEHELECITAQHKAELQVMTQRLVDSEAALLTSHRDSQETNLRRRISEMSTVETQLRKEMEVLREGKECIEIDLHKIVLERQEEMSIAHQRNAMLESDRQVCVRNIECLTQDLHDYKSKFENQRVSLLNALTEVEKLNDALQVKESELLAAKEDLKFGMERIVNERNEEKDMLTSQVEALKKRIYSTERRLKEAAQVAAERASSSSFREETMKTRMSAEITNLQTVISDLKREQERMSREAKIEQVARAESNHRHQRENDALKSEVNRLCREKDVLLQRLTQSNSSLEESKSESRAYQVQLEIAQKRSEAAKTQLAEHQEKITEPIVNTEPNRSEIERLEKALTDSTNQNNQYVAIIKAFQLKVLSLKKEYENKSKDDNRQAEKALQHEKRRVIGYKLELLKANNIISRINDDIKARNSMAFQHLASWNSSNSLNQRLNEDSLQEIIAKELLSGAQSNILNQSCPE